jgi:polar amino acid transport system substrate-binding protein
MRLACVLALAVSVAVVAAAPAPATAQDIAAQSEKRVLLRFLTTPGFPPFNYYDDEGVLVGLNIDLARAICLDLSLACDIRVRDWNELLPALKRSEADVVMAGHAISSDLLREFDFTDRYFHTPGRFVLSKTSDIRDITPDNLIGLTVGVVDGTAHQAFLKAFFRDSRIKAFPDAAKAREALRDGKLNAVFGDSISLAFWLNGTLSRQCCEFRGGAYFEPRFFGNGLAMTVSRKDPEVKVLVDAALNRIRDSGRLDELVQRYFPIRAF